MNEIQFEVMAHLPDLTFAIAFLTTKDGKKIIESIPIKKELFDFPQPLDLFTTNEEKGHEVRAFELQNGYILVTSLYTYTFLPSMQDFENALNAKAHWAAVHRAYKPKNVIRYKKKIDKANPRARFWLDLSGQEHAYWEYRAEAIKPFLEAFTPKYQVQLEKNVLKLADEAGRVVYHFTMDHLPLWLFPSEEEFDLWSAQPYLSNMAAIATDRVWQGRNPYHADILNHKEELLQQLADIAGMKREEIQIGKGTHEPLHRQLEKLTFDDRLAKRLFLPLTIYLGEQQISWYGGEWKLIEMPLIQSWVPIIRFQNQDYDIGTQTYYDLLNPEGEDFPSIATVLWNGKVPIPAKLK